MKSFTWRQWESGDNNPMPQWLGDEWRNLTEFTWIFSSTTSTFPASIATLPMTYIDVSNTGLVGPIPPELATMSTLESLYLGGNNFDGTLASDWSALTQLRYLNLERNSFTGNLPTLLPPNLVIFSIFDNQLTGDLPQSYFDLPNIDVIDVSGNALTGTLKWPTSPATSVLRELSVARNPNLGGFLSPKMWEIPTFSEIYIEDTRIRGPIPDNIGPDCRLEQFIASNTPIGGSLPPSLSSCKRLRKLLLSNAGLTGSVPASYLNLTRDEHLGHLFLDKNRLNLCGDNQLNNDSVPVGLECDVSGQLPRECGCVGVWSECLIEEMLPVCPPAAEPLIGATTSIASIRSWISFQSPSTKTLIATIGCLLFIAGTLPI